MEKFLNIGGKSGNSDKRSEEPQQKVVPSNNSNKNPIWQYFCLLETDNSKATCHLCGSNLSLGSIKPKNQTTTNIKNHLKSKHLNEFTKFIKNMEDMKSKAEKRIRDMDCKELPHSVKNKKQKVEMFQQTIPGYVAETEEWDIHSNKAQEIHKDIFIMLVDDMQPWSMVCSTFAII